MKSCKNAGFSLLELIIVIAIMAVLVGIIAPQYLKYVERTKRQVDVNNAHEIAKCFTAVLASNPDIGTVQDGMLTGAVFLYPDAPLVDPPQNVVDAVKLAMGHVPRSKTNKDWWWYFEYDVITGEVKRICLSTSPATGGIEMHELYPDPYDFLHP